MGSILIYEPLKLIHSIKNLNITKMEKSIQNLMKKLSASDNMLKYNFISIKGGSSLVELDVPENSHCTNNTQTGCTKSTNTNSCFNSYDCSDSTNSGLGCSNSSACFA